MRTNYILIDYENVQPETLNALDKEHFKVFVFVGALQSKITFGIAESMQRLGSNAQYVKASKTGGNALDFFIAFYIGQIAATDPTAYFHIISKDSGFDPLIAYLKTEKKILASRSNNIHDIPIVKTSNCHTLPERLKIIVANLEQRGAAKPRTVKTLSSTILSIFQKALSDKGVAEIIKELEKQKVITVTDTKVTYSCPAEK